LERLDVFNRFANALLTAAVTIAIGAGAAIAQTPPKQQWKDGQAEYSLYEQVTKAPDASKRLAALDAWKQKYPESDFKQQRLVTYLATYQQLNQPAKMIETSKEILAIDPKEVNALMWLAYITVTQPATAD